MQGEQMSTEFGRPYTRLISRVTYCSAGAENWNITRPIDISLRWSEKPEPLCTTFSYQPYLPSNFSLSVGAILQD